MSLQEYHTGRKNRVEIEEKAFYGGKLGCRLYEYELTQDQKKAGIQHLNSICDDKAFAVLLPNTSPNSPRSDTMVSSRSLFAALRLPVHVSVLYTSSMLRKCKLLKMYNRGICFLKVPLIKLFRGILELSIPAK